MSAPPVADLPPRAVWRRHPALTVAAVMAVAFNLRPALSSIGPLLGAIETGTGLSATGAAWLTTLPVLSLGLACALGPFVIRRAGPGFGVLVSLLMVAAGLSLRGFGTLPTLFAGAMLAAAGIGLAGVLLPALVKRDFARHAGTMTGLYTMALCIGAAAGAGFTVPIQDALGRGWGPALAIWAVPAVLAALAWMPFAKPVTQFVAPASGASASARGRLHRNPLAWQVTGFMGLQSSLAYVQFGWLPMVLQGRGLSPLDAGFVVSLSILGQAPGALLVAALAARGRDQRIWIVVTMLVTVLAFVAVAYGPAAGLIPAGLVLGFVMGGCFGLGLTLIVLRAPDAASAGALSAMAQSIGYTLASLGPLAFGLAREATGGWGLSTILFGTIALAALLCGLGAGRDRQIEPGG